MSTTIQFEGRSVNVQRIETNDSDLEIASKIVEFLEKKPQGKGLEGKSVEDFFKLHDSFTVETQVTLNKLFQKRPQLTPGNITDLVNRTMVIRTQNREF